MRWVEKLSTYCLKAILTFSMEKGVFFSMRGGMYLSAICQLFITISNLVNHTIGLDFWEVKCVQHQSLFTSIAKWSENRRCVRRLGGILRNWSDMVQGGVCNRCHPRGCTWYLSVPDLLDCNPWGVVWDQVGFDNVSMNGDINYEE